MMNVWQGAQDPELLAAKKELTERFLKPHNRLASVSRSDSGQRVHAVGIGRIDLRGKLTDQTCINIYVTKRVPPSGLLSAERLPERFEGFPTQIIESPLAVLSTSLACTAQRQARQRPIRGGISCGHYLGTAGTIACICRSRVSEDPESARFLLSNSHVLCDSEGAVGDVVVQPGPHDSGGGFEDTDLVARLHRFTTTRTGPGEENTVDAAIAKLEDGIMFERAVCGLGLVNDTAEAQLDSVVRMHGRTSGLTEGIISAISVDAQVEIESSHSSQTSAVAYFTDQLRIDRTGTTFGRPGDSGSLVVEMDSGKAVGLYFAGPEHGDYGYANRIQNVFDVLDCSIK